MIRTMLDALPFAGGGIVLAQLAPIIEGGEKMKEWPVTVLLAVLVLASLSVVTFTLKGMFAAQKTLAESQKNVAVAVTKAASAMNELSARLNVRPCLLPPEEHRR
jgi:hypothetical protein